MELIGYWHETRADFERQLYALTNDSLILKGSSGEYEKQWFKGHCQGDGGRNYLAIEATTESLRNVARLYKQ